MDVGGRDIELIEPVASPQVISNPPANPGPGPTFRSSHLQYNRKDVRYKTLFGAIVRRIAYQPKGWFAMETLAISTGLCYPLV